MKLVDFIICDDIRQETGNKFSLMGVYNNEMIVNFNAEEAWPYVTKLAFFMRLELNSERPPNSFSFRILRDKEVKSEVPLNYKKKNVTSVPITLVVVVFPLLISKSGLLEFQLKCVHEDKTETILNMPGLLVSSIISNNDPDLLEGVQIETKIEDKPVTGLQ